MLQEVGFRMFQGLGIELIDADPPTFLDDGPTSKLVRVILGAVNEFEKAMLVAKLKEGAPGTERSVSPANVKAVSAMLRNGRRLSLWPEL
jgi:hypothetical protein